MKLEDVDCLLEELSQEFNVSIPDYQVWEMKLIKKLKPIDSAQGGYIRISFSRPFSAFLQYSGKSTCLTLIVDKRHILRKESVVHEFFHHKHYIEQGYKFQDNLEEEEKLTKKETRRYLKKK